MGAFEDFVNAELPRRPVMLTLANTGYSGDPNSSVAPIINNAPVGSFFLNDADFIMWKKNEGTSTSWEQIGSGEGGGFTFTTIDDDESKTIPENTTMLYAGDITILDGNLTIEGDITPVIIDGPGTLNALTNIAPTSSIIGTQSSVTSHLTPSQARTVMDVLSSSEVAASSYLSLSSTPVVTATTVPGEENQTVRFRITSAAPRTLQLPDPSSFNDGARVAFQHWGGATNVVSITLSGNGNNIESLSNPNTSVASYQFFATGSMNIVCRWVSDGLVGTERWVVEDHSGCLDVYRTSNTLKMNSVNHTDTGGGLTNTTFNGDDGVFGRVEGGGLQELLPYHLQHVAETLSTITDATTGTETAWVPGGSANPWYQSRGSDWSGVSSLTVQGIDSSPNSANFCPVKIIRNSQGSSTVTITFEHESGSAVAANRISIPGNDTYHLGIGESVILRYDTSVSRWVMLGSHQVARALGVTEFLNSQVTTTASAPITISTFTTTENGSTSRFKFSVQALQIMTGDAALFEVSALVYRDGSGVLTTKDLTFLNGPFRDQLAWNVILNLSGSDIQIQVVGENLKSIKWSINGHVQED